MDCKYGKCWEHSGGYPEGNRLNFTVLALLQGAARRGWIFISCDRYFTESAIKFQTLLLRISLCRASMAPFFSMMERSSAGFLR